MSHESSLSGTCLQEIKTIEKQLTSFPQDKGIKTNTYPENTTTMPSRQVSDISLKTSPWRFPILQDKSPRETIDRQHSNDNFLMVSEEIKTSPWRFQIPSKHVPDNSQFPKDKSPRETLDWFWLRGWQIHNRAICTCITEQFVMTSYDWRSESSRPSTSSHLGRKIGSENVYESKTFERHLSKCLWGNESITFSNVSLLSWGNHDNFEQIELQAKLLNYFLGSNKSNINQAIEKLSFKCFDQLTLERTFLEALANCHSLVLRELGFVRDWSCGVFSLYCLFLFYCLSLFCCVSLFYCLSLYCIPINSLWRGLVSRELEIVRDWSSENCLSVGCLSRYCLSISSLSINEFVGLSIIVGYICAYTCNAIWNCTAR